MNTVIIHPYSSKYRVAFHAINCEWLNEFYFVTPEDEKILKAPERIIAGGGEIFFAELNGSPVGTCAMIKTGNEEFELAKMGVLQTHRGKKIGEKLLESALDFATLKQAKKVTLETAKKLKPAIALYTKYGFKKVSDEYTHPLFGRTIFKMELVL